MRLNDRASLINRGLAVTEELHPASLVFTGFPAVAATRRATAQTQALRFGGMTGSAPAIYLIRKTLLPEGLALVEKQTVFLDGTTRMRLDALDNEPHEPHVRLTCDLADK